MDRLKLITKNANKLLNNKFRKLSDTEYIYRFPVYKYKSQTMITCIITADIGDKSVTVDAVNKDGTLYTPYYNKEYGGRNLVLEEVQDKINKEIDKMVQSKLIRRNK